VSLRGGFDPIHLVHAQSQRLFTQHMFARFHRFDRPFGVQVVWEWVVDHVDVGVGEQRIVRTIGTRSFFHSFAYASAESCEREATASRDSVSMP
jgi:hypothetical protein